MRGRWWSTRALVLHLLVITVVPLCGIAFWWQLHQALDGNGLSWAYTVEWPCFAVLAVVGWWQLLHEDGAAREARARRAATTTVGAGDDAADGVPDHVAAARVAAAAQRELDAHVGRLADDGLSPWGTPQGTR